MLLIVASLHGTAGVSVGGHMLHFHGAVAAHLAGTDRPFVVGIDANEPKTERLDPPGAEGWSQAGAVIHPAVSEDAGFLREVLAMAAEWGPGAAVRPVDEVLAEPAVALYVEGWPQEGDVGVVAVGDAGIPIGASWWRYFDLDQPGFGFVSAEVPELTVAAVPAARGGGVGAALLSSLMATAGERGVARLCLRVEADNPAVRLYERLGFRVVDDSTGALTMVIEVDLSSPGGAGDRSGPRA